MFSRLARLSPKDRFLHLISAEYDRIMDKYPGGDDRLIALSEEHGELNKAVLDFKYKSAPAGDVLAEAMQVAAMAMVIGIHGDATMTVPGSYAAKGVRSYEPSLDEYRAALDTPLKAAQWD